MNWPPMQGYDSVVLRLSELGGQTRNLSINGTHPAEGIWSGTSGSLDDADFRGSGRRTKMSKSLGNYIGMTGPRGDVWKNHVIG